jgi:hypothetical protein
LTMNGRAFQTRPYGFPPLGKAGMRSGDDLGNMP